MAVADLGDRGRGDGQSSVRLTLEFKLVLPCLRAFNQQALYIPVLFPLKITQGRYMAEFYFYFLPH